MVKARAKQSVSEQMKKRIEDLVIFFELLLDKIKTMLSNFEYFYDT